jgi:hypothetical protein
MKEQLKQILTRMEKKEAFEELVKSAIRQAKHDHPHYKIDFYSTASTIKRFMGTYYNWLDRNGLLEPKKKPFIERLRDLI